MPQTNMFLEDIKTLLLMLQILFKKIKNSIKTQIII